MALKSRIFFMSQNLAIYYV